MIKTSKWASLASLAILAMPLTLSAQDEAGADEAPPPLSDIWMLVVKPGMQAEFNAAMATHLAFRKDAGESRDWQAYRVSVGHNMKPIQFRSCCFNWADFDSHLAEAEEKGFGDHFNENVAQYVDHFHHYIDSTDWGNSHWPDEGTSGPYYAVTSWSNKQGRGPESNDAMGKMSQLAKDEGWAKDDNNWLWFSRAAGGDSVTALVSSYSNFADMEPPEQSFYAFAVDKLGEVEADKMFADFAGGFDDSEYTIWLHDESLSTAADEDTAD
ncbi:MAG: hypothetical protein ACR2QL_09770 [Woeseiaceae bacterium]